MKAKTRGGIIVEKIKVGETYYDHSPEDSPIEVTITTKPVLEGSYWKWKVKTSTGVVKNFLASNRPDEQRFNPLLYKNKTK